MDGEIYIPAIPSGIPIIGDNMKLDFSRKEKYFFTMPDGTTKIMSVPTPPKMTLPSKPNIRTKLKNGIVKIDDLNNNNNNNETSKDESESETKKKKSDFYKYRALVDGTWIYFTSSEFMKHTGASNTALSNYFKGHTQKLYTLQYPLDTIQRCKATDYNDKKDFVVNLIIKNFNKTGEEALEIFNNEMFKRE